MSEIELLQEELDTSRLQCRSLYSMVKRLLMRLGDSAEFTESEWNNYNEFKIATERIPERNTFKVTLHRRP